MQVIVAKKSGLCYGVKRALRMAKETRKIKKQNVYTFGDLIHNPQVIANLEKQGIHSINDLDQVDSGPIILRSHGVSPKIYSYLQKKNIEIVDATCPIVKKIQKLVEELASQGDEIIIVGNKEHPEIEGLIGYSKGRGIIVENERQVRALPSKKRRAVLAQSTQDLYLFHAVVNALIEKTKELKVFNTICRSTQTRQKSTSELASEVDTLFIIGGKKSSNTQKLYQISKRILPHTYFIEKAEQITPDMIKGAKKIGLSGGASTPPEVIEKAVAKIKSSCQRQSQTEKRVQCQN